MPQPGTLIEGKYEILGKIREGGMGTIYKVRHRLLDEVRVVKVMKPSITADEEMKRRFIEEAKMATRLKHPNIGTIHDFALDDDGTAYLVMEFIDGVNLAELLHSKGPPSVPLALEITHQALLALGYLHRRNVIHRDVAPDNLMLARDEEGNPRVKLIDLGIAKALDRPVDLTSTGVFLGKLKYASPEQYGSLPAGEKLDGRSDLYCLGVVIYELLTSTRPFAGETPAELLRAHLFSPPIAFEQTDPQGTVPSDVRRVILKALEKKREDRFATAEEFDREIVELRHRYGEAESIESTVQLLTPGRRVPAGSEGPTVTPSAQNRLDRQFLAGTTPSVPRRELSTVDRDSPPPATVKTNSKAGAKIPVRPLRWIWILAAAAGVILAAALTRPWESRRPAGAVAAPTAPPLRPTPGGQSEVVEQPTAVAPTAAPLTEVPTEPTAPPRPTSPDTSAADRVAADQARQRCARARASADRAGAAQKVPGPYGEARRAQAEGDRLLAKRRYGAAQDAYQRSAERFSGAERAIAQITVKPPGTAVALAPTAHPEPTHAPTVVAVVVHPTAAVAEPTKPSVSEQERVREAIHRYERAQSELDPDAYVRIFPAVDKGRIRDAFAALRSQTVEVSVQRVEIAPGGSSAVVVGMETRTAVPRVGNEQHFSSNRVFRLEKRGDVWVIAGLGS